MATVQGKGVSINLTDPWAQRIVGVGICAIGFALAATIYRAGGIRLIVEGDKMAAPGLIAGAAVGAKVITQQK